MHIVTGKESLLKIRKNYLFIPLTFIGLVCTGYVLLKTPNMDGTELFFTIPLTWTISAFIFSDIIAYHENGFALKIFYLLLTLKYLFLPWFTCYVGTFSGEFGFFSPEAYVFSIIMQNIELLVSCGVIKYYYGRTYVKERKKLKNKTAFHNKMSLGGLLVLGVAVLIIAVRGVNRMLSKMRFGLITEAMDEESMYGYDIWLAQTMMAFLVIMVVEFFSERERRKPGIFNCVIPLVTVVLTCMCTFGNNRTMIVYYAICGLIVLLKAFPSKKRFFYSIIGPSFLLVIVSFTLLKQFHIDLSGTSGMRTMRTDLSSIQQYLTSYLCGTESIAKCYHLYGVNGKQMQFFTLFADIVNKTSILGLPGLNTIVQLFENIPTSYSLAMYWVEIVPIVGQAIFYGGYILGPIIDIIAYIVVIRLLIKCEVRGKLSNEIADAYLFTWLAGIFSFCMCRSLAVMYANCSYIPFYLSIALAINKYIRIRQRKKKEVRD